MAPAPKGGGWRFWHEKSVLDSLVRPERTGALPTDISRTQPGEQLEQDPAVPSGDASFWAGLTEAVSDAIICTDENLCIVQFNPAAERMFGLPDSRIRGQSIASLFPENVRPRYLAQLRRFFRSAMPRLHLAGSDRIQGRRANDETFVVEVTLFQATAAGQRLIAAIVRESGSRLHPLQALADNPARSTVFATLAVEGIVISEQGRIIDCNEQFAQMTGFTAEELAGQPYQDLVVQEDRDRVGENIRHGREGTTEYALLRKNGVCVMVEAHDREVPVASPDSRRYTALCDISHRKRTEYALRERAERYELALAGAQRAVWEWNVIDRRVRCSAQWKALRGWADHEIGEGEAEWGIGIHPEDRVRVGTALQAHLAGKTSVYAAEYRIQCRDGAYKWVSDRGAVQRDSDGRVMRMAGSVSDVTGRKQIDAALRASQADLNRAQSVGQIGSWRWDASLDLVHFSAENYRIFGMAEGTPLTWDIFLACVHPEDRPAVAQMWTEASAVKPYEIEHRLIVDETVKWVRERAELEVDAQGKILGGFGTTQDVTALKQAEQAWADADQRKDEFLAMLAHELRNPLAPILNAAHVLGRLQMEEPRIRWAQEVIERQVKHLTRLVDDLLDVTRIVRGKIALEIEPIELADWVAQSVGMARPLIDARGHQLEVRLPAQPAHLVGDSVRLAQVLLNLLDNAAKFTPNGGMIRIDCDVAGSDIKITVSDNGIGIPAASLPHIFDLFHQEKDAQDRSQGGLGIGLTLVKQLIEKHNGQLQAYSGGVGQGAAFSVTLPRSDN